MRLLTLFCAIAMAFAFAMPAQAAVQNVKVSGDITLWGFYRDELDLNEGDNDYDDDAFIASQVGVNVEADLTDNVSAVVRMVNQRDVTTDSGTNTDLDIDLAYVTLKELLYSPLTVTIGRQDIKLGDGFIIGGRYQDQDFAQSEFTTVTSFDAIKAVVDYDPWTITGIYAKIAEGTLAGGDGDDIDLYALNVGYVFEQYEAEAEGYYVARHDASQNPSDEVHTLGIRGSAVPLENLLVKAELAFQFGDDGNTTNDYQTWATDISAEYTFADIEWVPVIGVEYVFLSGDENPASGDNEDFQRLYPSKTYSLIRDWQGVYYTTDDTTDDAGNTNEHIIMVRGEAQPIENLTVAAKYLYFLQAENDSNGEDALGSEVDVSLTYDYTEDVSVGLMAGWFFPGDVYTSPNDETATLIAGVVGVAF